MSLSHGLQPDPGPTPLLELRAARRRFGSRAALAGVDLRIDRGELVALIGANGAGKTTLLRAVCGRLRLDGGAVSVGGQDPRADPGVRRLIGLVPQSLALYASLPVRSNLRIFGQLMGLHGRRLHAAVEAALEWSGLRERAGDPVRLLSGGMQRRVNIAAGTLHDPALLLLDEPTVGLDPAVRGSVHEVLRLLKRRGMAILMSTHDLREAEELADRVVLLAAGAVCIEGRPAELVERLFAGARELNLLLHEDPSPQAGAVLEAAGLVGTAQRRLWVGTAGSSLAEVDRLREHLSAGGVPIEEIRLREPGLEGVFLRLTGQVLE